MLVVFWFFVFLYVNMHVLGLSESDGCLRVS